MERLKTHGHEIIAASVPALLYIPEMHTAVEAKALFGYGYKLIKPRMEEALLEGVVSHSTTKPTSM